MRVGGLLDLGLLDRPPTAPPARILVLGDADCSYSSALSRRLGPRGAALCVTTFEDEDGLLQRYPHATAAVAALRHDGRRVCFGVDARALHAHFPDELPWQRIVFNLPQAPPLPGARNQIQRHRALLREICVSAQQQLAADGQLWVTLLSGQGGTPLDPIQRSHGDTWQIMHEAARAGLVVSAVAAADVDALAEEGYTGTGRRPEQNRAASLGRKRASKGMVVHVLQQAAAGARGVAPLEWLFDNSFWLGDGGAPVPDAAALWEAARAALREGEAHALGAPPRLVDEYTRPEDGRLARTYKFHYASQTLPLSREAALDLNRRACEGVVARHGATRRDGRASPPPAEAEAVAPAASPAATPAADDDDDARETSPPQPSRCDGDSAGVGEAAAAAAAAAEEEEVAAAADDDAALPARRDPLYGGRWRQDRGPAGQDSEGAAS